MRDHLIDTAMALYYQHGFHAVGVDLIAKKAGTTRTTFYNYFESKDDLILTVLRERSDHWWRDTFEQEISRRGGDDPLAQLLAIFDVLGDWFATQDFNGCLLVNASSAFPDQNDPAHQLAIANRSEMHGSISRLAKQAGIQDSDRFATCFRLLIEGAIATKVVDRDSTASATAAELAKLLIQATLTKKVN